MQEGGFDPLIAELTMPCEKCKKLREEKDTLIKTLQFVMGRCGSPPRVHASEPADENEINIIIAEIFVRLSEEILWHLRRD